jgi:hypothetical protein
MSLFLTGALSATSLFAGLLFLRFWRQSGDRLFAFLAIAFWALALNWTWLGVFQPVAETRHYVYVVRLVAFVLIMIGVIDKNRRARSGPQ